jgi:hypothetical protein
MEGKIMRSIVRAAEHERRSKLVRVAVLGALAATLMSVLLPGNAVAADRIRVEIVNTFSHLRADVMWASQSAFQQVFLWSDNTSASQEFDLLDSGNGFFRIRARHSGQCLMLDGRSGFYGNGTPIIQSPDCNAGNAAAEWQLRTLPAPTDDCPDNICTGSSGPDLTVLVNRATGRCLDSDNGAGGAPRVQAVLQQWDCVTSTGVWNIGNQAWDILRPGSHLL